MTSRIRRARLPASGRTEIVIAEEDWKRIEQAYGHDLPLEVREYIRFVTYALSVVENVERSAPALEKLKAEAKRLSDAAQSLLKAAGWPAPTEIDTSIEILTEALATAVKEYANDHVQFLLMVYAALEACNLMLHAWEADGGLREGWIWDAWVQGISEKVEHHGLPSAVRKDSDKRDAENVKSPFVRLIRELHKHVPEELRRHDPRYVTKDRLEQAIYRARKSNWWPVLLPANIREKFASELESPKESAERFERFKQRLRTSPGWIERRPGSFVNEDSPYEKIIRKQREQKLEPDSQDTDDAAP
jgi:hypothetical protein